MVVDSWHVCKFHHNSNLELSIKLCGGNTSFKIDWLIYVWFLPCRYSNSGPIGWKPQGDNRKSKSTSYQRSRRQGKDNISTAYLPNLPADWSEWRMHHLLTNQRHCKIGCYAEEDWPENIWKLIPFNSFNLIFI